MAELDVQKLIDELRTYNIAITIEQAQLFLRHLDLVIKKNKAINLTRIVDVDEGIDKHILDSLIFMKAIPFDPLEEGCNFLDMGTGAGFPGIPLAIATKWHGTLVDSTQKKINAVCEFINELKLKNVEAKACRVEELAKVERNRFDFVVARAVAETSVLIEYASPLLKRDGVLVISKGHPSEDECAHAGIVSRICKMRHVSRETIILPHEFGERELICYQKKGEAEIKLPRRNGLARIKPLYESRI